MKNTNKKQTMPSLITDAYGFAWAKFPRGKGNWMFAESANPKSGETFCPGYMMYSAAKKRAKEHFKGNSIIYLLP